MTPKEYDLDYVKIGTHIDLAEDQAAIVFLDKRIELYLPPQAIEEGTQPNNAVLHASMCAIFLQQPPMVEAVLRLMQQELPEEDKIRVAYLVLGQCPFCFGINKHEDNCKARIVGQCPVCRGVNVHESTCALLKGV